MQQIFSFISLLIFITHFCCGQVDFITYQDLDDLQFNRLVESFDSTLTQHGKTALKKILMPTNNIAQIQANQNILKTIVSNQSLYQEIETSLTKIKKYESACAIYQQQSNANALLFALNNFYFKAPQFVGKKNFIGKIIHSCIDFCNNSSLILETSILKKFFDASYPILSQLCLSGLVFEYNQFVLGLTDSFNISRALKIGLETPIREHSWKPFLTAERVARNIIVPYSTKEQFPIWLKGSLRDRYEVLRSGSADKKIINIFNITEINAALFPLHPIIAFLGAISGTVGYDIIKGSLFLGAYNSFIQDYQAVNDARTNLYNLKQYLLEVEKLSILIEKNLILPTPLFHPQTRSELIHLLKAKTFDTATGNIYRRGLVLYTHKEILNKKNNLHKITLSVGTIDAYMAIARFIKKYHNSPTPVCFTEFIDTHCLVIEDGWSPTTPDFCITNSIQLGKSAPEAIILSGPHGCGKSTILTMIGGFIITSHSLGIGCARSMQISLCKGIRATLKTEAQPELKISTFMAAQKAMLRIESFMDSLAPHETGIILLGEPYKGTVEAEAAYRINEFCQRFAHTNNVLMALETHVYEPTELATSLPHKFTNGHMHIKSLEDGSFERTFTLAKGPALWWFKNAGLRSDYVDWINMIMQKQLAQES